MQENRRAFSCPDQASIFAITEPIKQFACIDACRVLRLTHDALGNHADGVLRRVWIEERPYYKMAGLSYHQFQTLPSPVTAGAAAKAGGDGRIRRLFVSVEGLE